MTMLTNTGNPSDPARYSVGWDAAGTDTPTPHMAMIGRVCRSALIVLIVAVGLTGIIALKAAIYLSRFSY